VTSLADKGGRQRNGTRDGRGLNAGQPIDTFEHALEEQSLLQRVFVVGWR